MDSTRFSTLHRISCFRQSGIALLTNALRRTATLPGEALEQTINQVELRIRALPASGDIRRNS